MKSTPISAPASSMSSRTGLPSMMPARAVGASIMLWLSRMAAYEQRPGTTALAPPLNPAK